MKNDSYTLGIIGGGIFGCAIAYQFTRAFPREKIAIFERSLIGSGCSGFAGAIATPYVRYPILSEWSDYSREWYQNYQVEHQDAPLNEIPIFYVTSNTKIADLIERLNTKLEQLDPYEKPLWLNLNKDEQILSGARALRANVSSLCQQMLLRSSSVDVFEGVPVCSYKKDSDSWQIMLSDGRVYISKQLVLAKGAWLADAEQTMTDPVMRKKIVSYILELNAVPTDCAIYFSDYESFLLPIPEKNHWLLSILSTQWNCRPESKAMVANEEDLKLAERILNRYAPTLKSRLRGARVHCDTYGVEHQPNASVTSSGSIVSTGGSGSGFRYAPALARQVLQILSQYKEEMEART